MQKVYTNAMNCLLDILAVIDMTNVESGWSYGAPTATQWGHTFTSLTTR